SVKVKDNIAPTLVGTDASTSERAIVPWVYGDNTAAGNGSDLVTHDSNGGFRTLTSDEYLTVGGNEGGLPNADTNSNLKVTINQTATATNGVNGLVVGNASIDLGGNTLNVKSGAILMSAGTGATQISNGVVAFGSAE